LATESLFKKPAVLSVSDLNRLAREVLEHNFPLFWVAGEISNLTRAASGHWYFSLKDDKAQVRCIMFRNKNMILDWQPREGDHVEARALVTLYEARGDFQLNIEALQRAGLGALFEAFERLKARLEREGLFDASRRRPLPAHPRQVGIVTSPDAAALRDVLTTLRRRMPAIPVVIYPTPVQGKGAAELIAQAIRTAGERAECDVLLVCRGGGSMEDLWQFNEETVARAIADSPIPVVSGIGHETDFTIADFVADLRAPTPTAAAELVSPDRLSMLNQLARLKTQLMRQINFTLTERMQKLDTLTYRLIQPGEKIRRHREQALHLQTRLVAALGRRLENAHARFSTPPRALQRGMAQQLLLHRSQLLRVSQNITHLDPQQVLNRGYSLVRTTDGMIVRSSAELKECEVVQITFARGSAGARITYVEP
jgi:exodeoxyribonuclease VII large subunit